MALQLTKRRFTVSEYHQMAEAGILGEDDRVELIDGEVTEMVPIGRRHSGCVNRLNKLFVETFGYDAVVSVQNPIVLGDYTEPQPDLSILKPRSDFYSGGHPTPEDIFLLVEVGETSADLDREVKVPLYARSGIAEVWLVDLEQETVTIYRDPAPAGYRTGQLVRRGGRLAPLAFPGRWFEVAGIVG